MNHDNIIKHFEKCGLIISDINCYGEPFAYRDETGSLRMRGGLDMIKIEGRLNCHPDKLPQIKVVEEKNALWASDAEDIRINRNPFARYLEITKIIFNNPATIVFWNDGTKTVVKCCDGDSFDEEKGILMAMYKKMYGSVRQLKRDIDKKATRKANEITVEKLITAKKNIEENYKPCMIVELGIVESEKHLSNFSCFGKYENYPCEKNSVKRYVTCMNCKRLVLGEEK